MSLSLNDVSPQLNDLAGSIRQADNLEALTRPLLALLERLTGLESAYLTEVDEQRGLQRILYVLNSGELQIDERLEVQWRDTLCRRALKSGQFMSDNVAATWGDSDAARELGIQTYMGVPVNDPDGGLYGTLCAASQHRRTVAEPMLDVMALFAELITQQLGSDRARRRQSDRAERAERRLSKLAVAADLGRLCLRSRALWPVIEYFAERLRSMDSWSQVIVFIFRGGRIEVVDPETLWAQQALEAVVRARGGAATLEVTTPVPTILGGQERALAERASPVLAGNTTLALLPVIGTHGLEGGLLLTSARHVSETSAEARLLVTAAQSLSMLAVRVDEHRRLVAANRELTVFALHDPLTGLPNRRYLVEVLERALARARRQGAAVHLAFVDLDGFKAINDRYGHRCGDEFLQAMADRLQKVCRAGDLAARYGGDEFVLVLSPDDGRSSGDTISAQLARRIEKATSGEFHLTEATIDYGGPSVGTVAWYPEQGGVQALLQHADEAMYEVKRARKAQRQ